MILNDEQAARLRNFYMFPPTDETIQEIGKMLTDAAEDSRLNDKGE